MRYLFREGRPRALSCPLSRGSRSPTTGASSSTSAGTRWGKAFVSRWQRQFTRKLGVPVEQVVAVIGDTRATPQHLSGKPGERPPAPRSDNGRTT
jgi:hypothetical protein